MSQQISAVLRLGDVQRCTGLRRSTIYERIQEGTFPKPIRLGAKSVGWIEREVMDWVHARIAERDSTKAA